LNNIFVLGKGFISDHLNYPKILDRITIYNIEEIILKYKPNILINCIGRTGTPNIDWCEIHKEETEYANTTLPILLANYCNLHKIHLIHVGSGCIFYGNSDHLDYKWNEQDIPNPKSFYSKSKYNCDKIISILSNVSILRIRMPISRKNNSRNLLNKLKNYNKLIDIPNSVTFMDDFVNAVKIVIDKQLFGIYNIVNPGALSAAQIMQEYKKYNPNYNFSIITEDELNNITLSIRSNCILDTNKAQNAGIILNNSQDLLSLYMKDFCENDSF
jgi:dTDP-4-dehydrorhamnose reductase